MRVFRKIRAGEEITINYILDGVKTTSERRKRLKYSFNFVCFCQACNITAEEEEEEKRLCEKFHEAEVELGPHCEPEDFDPSQPLTTLIVNMRQEIGCIRVMYKIAKDIGVLGKTALLDGIVERGYTLSVGGYVFANALSQRSEMDHFQKANADFWKVGVKVATLVYGQDHPVTVSWKVILPFSTKYKSQTIYKRHHTTLAPQVRGALQL